MKKIIYNGRILTPVRCIERGAVIVENGRISNLIEGVIAPPHNGGIDAGGRTIAPGFIDLHVHAVHEHLADGGPDELAAMCEILPRYGVTGILASLCPLPGDKGEATPGDLQRLAGF